MGTTTHLLTEDDVVLLLIKTKRQLHPLFDVKTKKPILKLLKRHT